MYISYSSSYEGIQENIFFLISPWKHIAGTHQKCLHEAFLITRKALLMNNNIFMFVCVEILWPSQPNGVMSSVVSLLNHKFTGQA